MGAVKSVHSNDGAERHLIGKNAHGRNLRFRQEDFRIWHETRIEIGVNDLLYAIASSEAELDVP